MSSCAKHKKHPLFPQFGESSKPFSAGGKSAWWLAGGYPDVPTVPTVPARACHMSLSRPKIFPNTRKNSGRDVRMPMNCRRRCRADFGRDFSDRSVWGRWGTWDVEAIGIDSYPIGSMYAIYGNIYHQYTPNVSIYTIHGSYGYWFMFQTTKWPTMGWWNTSQHFFYMRLLEF